jgi:hypothetical protein
MNLPSEISTSMYFLILSYKRTDIRLLKYIKLVHIFLQKQYQTFYLRNDFSLIFILNCFNFHKHIRKEQLFDSIENGEYENKFFKYLSTYILYTVFQNNWD